MVARREELVHREVHREMDSTCIIYSCDRQKRETCMLTTMEKLLQDARELLGYGQDDQLSVVLGREGARITKEDVLHGIAKKRDVLELMILNLTRQESWAPEEVPSKLTSPNISINQSQNIQIGDSNQFLQAGNRRDEDNAQVVMSVQGEKTEDISLIPDLLRRLRSLIARPKLWYELDKTARQVDISKVLDYRDENGLNVLHAAAFHNNENAVITIWRHFDWAALSTQVTSGTHPGELEGCTAKEIAVKKHHKIVADRIDSLGKTEGEMKPIHKIVRSRNLDEVKELCTRYHNLVNITDSNNFTPLHYAAGVGFLDGVKLLLEMGADLNAVTDYGETALGRACRMGYDDVVVYLIDEPDIDIKKSLHSAIGDLTCLDAAAEGNFRDIYNRLQHHGLTVTSNTLVCAARGGHLELVKEIAAMDGIDVNYQDKYGNTALIEASRYGHVNVVKCLINEHKADPSIQNKNGNAALHIAVLNNPGLGVVDCLLDEGGADPTILNNDGKNPAHCAARCGQVQHLDAVLRRIRGRRIDPNIQDKYGNTALCEASRYGHVNVVKCLINEHKADPSIQNKNGNTALHIAVLNKVGLDVVECLLAEGGADPTILNNIGKNPAHLASSSGQVQCLDTILRTHPGLMNKRGNLLGKVYLVRGKNGERPAWHYVLVKRKLLADFLVKTNGGSLLDVADYGKVLHSGWGKDPPDDIIKKIDDKYDTCEVPAPEDLTPLHHAVLEQHPAVVEKLLEIGADTDVRDAYKLTPLHLACMRGNREIVKLLVEAGADIKAADDDGDTPLDMAKLNHQDLTVNFLQKVEIVKFFRDNIQKPVKEMHDLLEHGLDTDISALGLKTQLQDITVHLTNGGIECLAKLKSAEDKPKHHKKETAARSKGFSISLTKYRGVCFSIMYLVVCEIGAYILNL